MLDDSSDKVTRELIDERVIEWREKGVNVVCLRRFNRHGYKAGALKGVRALIFSSVGSPISRMLK